MHLNCGIILDDIYLECKEKLRQKMAEYLVDYKLMITTFREPLPQPLSCLHANGRYHPLLHS